MTHGTLRVRALQIGSLVVAATLLSCAPAFADTTPTPTPSKTTTPVSAPKKSSTTPKSSGSAISTPVDTQTQAFRDALAKKQAELNAFKAQLEALDTELEIASQQYDAASDSLKQLTARVQVAQADLDKARAAYGLQSEILGKRASAIYKDGTLGGVEVLLDSKSVTDFVARVKFLNTVGLADAATANSFKAQKDQLEKQLVDLENAQAQASSLEFQMKARKIEVGHRVADRQAMYNSAQTDLLASLDSEAARRQTQESALLQDVLSGANKAGIVVTAGSPVETALAYHGVPYLWGGATPSGFDCSGLIMYTFAQHGVDLPHYSGSQFQLGEHIDLAAIQPNDVVFFGSPVHHVGLYCGGGYFIEAPRTGDFVKISKLSNRHDIAGVRRYPWAVRTAAPLGAKSSTTAALKNVP